MVITFPFPVLPIVSGNKKIIKKKLLKLLFWLESNVTDSKITSRQITFSAFKDIVPVFSQFVIIGMQILQTHCPAAAWTKVALQRCGLLCVFLSFGPKVWCSVFLLGTKSLLMLEVLFPENNSCYYEPWKEAFDSSSCHCAARNQLKSLNRFSHVFRTIPWSAFLLLIKG